jgi:5-methylcytosine-specific restriction enzyme subunit McrC
VTHFSVHEWGRVEVGTGGFSVSQAEILVAAARAHPLGGEDGGDILSDHRHYLRARQMVGVIAAPGCSLEILPKVDPEAPDEDAPTVRRRLVTLLDLALGLDLGNGAHAAMAHGADSLLDIIIRLFAEQLLAQVRRGLPRRYSLYEDDLPALRGRLNVVRQFTVHAVRPDRLACRYDVLSSNIPLTQVMKATVIFLAKLCHAPGTRRLLDELRFVLADISDVPPATLPWDKVRIDRTNRRWERLFLLARLLMKSDWQATRHSTGAREGISLLFPMNDLFEASVVTLLRRALSVRGIEVVEQGGLRHCLGDWAEGANCIGNVFQTKPDILLRHGSRILAVIDTKWKRLSADPLDQKKCVNQSDVYQMMAYARLYRCDRLMLLYPATSGAGSGIVRRFGIDGGPELLTLGRVDMAAYGNVIESHLMRLVGEVLDINHDTNIRDGRAGTNQHLHRGIA